MIDFNELFVFIIAQKYVILETGKIRQIQKKYS